MKNIIRIISVLMFASGFTGMNTYAIDKTGATKATASIAAACRIKVDNMAFGEVSMQSMSGNGDIFATTQLSLLCTKDQATTLTSNLGVNANGGTWVFGANYVCQTNLHTDWRNDGDQTSCYNFLYPQKGGQINSAPVFYSPGGYSIRFANVDGSTIAVGQQPPASSANLISGSNRIAYIISTNNNTYAPINSTASNPLTYNQNNGDWQNFPLYGKANVKQAAPGVYLDTNTITVNF